MDTQMPADAAHAVTALYQAHALGLVRLAVIMVGDQECAEDVVQDAFFGLYRNWDSLADTSSALAWVRSSVLNGCGGGSDLIADSRAVFSAQYPARCSQDTVLVTDDGKTILCAVTTQLLKDVGGKREFYNTMTLFAFSASTPTAGRPQFTITGYRQPSGVAAFNVLWSDASGGTVIVDWYFGSTRDPAWHVGVFSHGRFRPLPTPPGVDKPAPIAAWDVPPVTW